MKEKIIAKATDMFLKLGFKSVTMDDIAGEMCISKKTIYKYFCNKELLIAEGTEVVHEQIHQGITYIIEKEFNSIEENFEIRKMFREMFKSIDTSPVYQLKKHYPSIYETVISREIEEYITVFKQNTLKGIAQGLYRKETDIDSFVKFYYILIFNINETTKQESEVFKLEMKALEYHTRAIATPKGIIELEKQLNKHMI
jgi:AcrR family transcriptional regulator